MVLIIKHAITEGPGIIKEFFKRQGEEMLIVELGIGDKFPEIFSGVEAVISLGGPMNVYDEETYPFLKDEDTFVKKIMNRGMPFLGICLGSQILAKAAGAGIKKASFKEVGWDSVRLTPEGLKDPLFSGCPEKLEVFQWHEDKFDLPEQGMLLVESGSCPQALRIGKNAYGLQFHFEVTPNMIKSWLENEHDVYDTEKILQETADKQGRYYVQAYKILSNFYRIIKDCRRGVKVG